jgi:hypothetical protein
MLRFKPNFAAGPSVAGLKRPLSVGILVLAFGLGGCQFAAIVATGVHESGSKQVPAKYKGLKDKSFGVIVAADRAIQSDHPGVVAVITAEVTRRVAKDAGASGVIPPEDVLRFQGSRPGWVAMTARDVAKELGVERLIYIDLNEYSLTDPGNPYVWNGVASGIVGVVETDSPYIEEFVFRESVQVKFPDKENTGALDMPGDTVELEILRRFVNRCSWMFFDHEEPNIIEY